MGCKTYKEINNKIDIRYWNVYRIVRILLISDSIHSMYMQQLHLAL